MAATSARAQQYLRAMSPKYVWSMAEGYPVVIKQFLQFCLIIIYPAWVFAVLVGAAMHLLFYVTIYPVLLLLFWPMRAYQKKNHRRQGDRQGIRGPIHWGQRRISIPAAQRHAGDRAVHGAVAQVRRQTAVVNAP